MFFGDPYKFAIQCDVIDDWNDDYFWVNGIFNIYINGVGVLNEIYTSELKFTLANITEIVLGSMRKIEFTDHIVIDEGYSLSLSSPEMEDLSIFIYFLFDDEYDYILLKNNEGEHKMKYEKDFIKKVLYSIIKWKAKVGLF